MVRVTRAERDARNRAALIAAAEEVFVERGIEGSSLDEIAERAGLTKGALYPRFASKGELILAVIEHRLREDPDAEVFASVLTDATASSEERLERWIAQWATAMRSGSRTMFARLLFEFVPYALAEPGLRSRLAETLGLADAAPSAAQHEGAAMFSPIPPDSALAALPEDAQQRILNALDIGLAFQSLIAPEQTDPELYGMALRLLTDTPRDD